MKRGTALVGLAVAASGLTLVATGDPASAAVTTSVVGTNLTVTVTGDETVGFSCASGQVRVNGTATTPTMACATLAGITINGDAGNQTIQGDQITAARFPAIASVSINAGAGNDAIFTSLFYDVVQAGPGDDGVVIDARSVAEPDIQMGGQPDDTIYVEGTASDDVVLGSSSGTNGNLTIKVGSGPTVGHGYSAAAAIVVNGGAGDDTLDMKSMFTPVITQIDLNGGAGDDLLVSATQPTNLIGGSGTNTFDGGATADQIFSTSDTDIIQPGSGNNVIFDRDSLRSGGRTVASEGGTDTYETTLTRNDAVWRLRPGAAGATKGTASLNRPGIALNPHTVDSVKVVFAEAGEPNDHTIADIVASTDTEVFVSDGLKKTTVVDITIPTGSWASTFSSATGNGVINPTDPALGTIYLSGVGKISIHEPWESKPQGWAHRVFRDLMFDIPSIPVRDDLASVIFDGSVSRADAAAAIQTAENYTGLDVDRVFVKYLRRSADPSGRTYWINSIQDGKALWRFRAQLFGSSEYFTKAGGTNASYVEKAYSDVLGRSPDPSGKAYWTNKLNNGADRGSVALQFINSPEARRRLVDDQFLRFLDRLPTANEQATWVAQIPTATGEQRLIAFLAGSNEYYNRT